jgi:hypothetical protein
MDGGAGIGIAAAATAEREWAMAETGWWSCTKGSVRAGDNRFLGAGLLLCTVVP